jgi:DNA-binding NarL/FixJ family response regulator
MVVSVFLLDDHELVRRGICQLLDTEADISVVGEAATAARALARIPALRPMSRSSTYGCPTDTASVSAGRSGPRSSRHRRA